MTAAWQQPPKIQAELCFINLGKTKTYFWVLIIFIFIILILFVSCANYVFVGIIRYVFSAHKHNEWHFGNKCLLIETWYFSVLLWCCFVYFGVFSCKVIVLVDTSALDMDMIKLVESRGKSIERSVMPILARLLVNWTRFSCSIEKREGTKKFHLYHLYHKKINTADFSFLQLLNETFVFLITYY